MSAYCVITTIHKPTPEVKAWEKRFGEKLIVIGDEETPEDWKCGKAKFYDTLSMSLTLKSWQHAPINYYGRKNLGYLLAMQRGAYTIWDTDDDNAPTYDWHGHGEQCEADVVQQKMWCNVYSMFHNGETGWPRGFPLTRIHACVPLRTFRKTIDSPIQQCMANGEHDVDAIFRLTTRPCHRGSIEFGVKKSIALAEGVWCPFNSQATWWFKVAFPLMYLPAHATFRMCDIWRSLIAQRCLWAMGKQVVFHSPAEVVQNRNKHDLLSDFESELPGYLHNEKIAKLLGGLKLERGKTGVLVNLRTCYEAMVEAGFLPKEELVAVAAWIGDVKRALK